MPQKPQQQDETKRSTDKVKLAVNIGASVPPIISIIRNARAASVFKNKAAAVETPFKTDFTTTAVAGLRGDATNPTVLGNKGTNRPFKTHMDRVADPKVDYGKMRNMSIFNPARAGQTQEFVKEIKAPLYKDAAREAIMNEARSSSKRGGIGRAINNAKISLGGTGTPAFAPVTPKSGSVPKNNALPKPSPELQKELNGARQRLREAKSVADVRSVVEDMNRMGKNDIWGVKLTPDFAASMRRLMGKPITKIGLKAFPWLSTVIAPAGLAIWENADAQNFAEEAKAKMTEAGGKGSGGAVVDAPTAPPKSAAANAALIKTIDQKFDSIGNDVVNDASIPPSKIHATQLRQFNEWLNSSKEHKDAFYSDPKTYERYSKIINPKK
jgi:hypothetical protein